jgi:hypothetical protein
MFSNDEVCPIGYNDRKLTLQNTTMVLPYGGSVTDDGIRDAFGKEVFALQLRTTLPVHQSGKAYPVDLGGVTISDGNKSDVLGDGKASYNPETNTLTLSGMELDSEYGQVLHATAGLNLKVEGKSQLSSGSERPGVEIQGGDFLIFGDKSAELTLMCHNGMLFDETGLYQMEVKRCQTEIIALGAHNKAALRADSLCVNAATLHIKTMSDDDDAVAWQSWNDSKSGGLVLKHAIKTEGTVNVNKEMSFAPSDPLLFKVTLTVDDEKHGTVSGEGWYEDGQVITLIATPKEGFKFVSWSDGNPDATRELTVDDDYELIAIFDEESAPQGLDSITNYQSPITNKVIINGQLFILRGEHLYTIEGALVK